jgi:hypothetical protein
MSFNLGHSRRDLMVYSLIIVTVVAAMAGIASIGFASAQTNPTATTGATDSSSTAAVASSTTAANSTSTHTCTDMGPGSPTSSSTTG